MPCSSEQCITRYDKNQNSTVPVPNSVQTAAFSSWKIPDSPPRSSKHTGKDGGTRNSQNISNKYLHNLTHAHIYIYILYILLLWHILFLLLYTIHLTIVYYSFNYLFIIVYRSVSICK